MNMSQTAPTTTILDPARITSLETPSKTIERVYNPYQVATFDKSLERMYVVAKGLWTTQPSGSLLARIKFPDVFAGFSQLVDKLSTFSYLRADVKVRIKLNGIMSQFGRLMYGALPLAPADIDCRYPQQLSGFTVTGTVSPNSPQTVEFTLPYHCPWPGIPTTIQAMPETGMLWQMLLMVLFPLDSSEVTPECYYTIEAGFTNIKLWGIANEAEITKNLTSLVPNPRSDTPNTSTNGQISSIVQDVVTIAPKLLEMIGSKPPSARPFINMISDNLYDANMPFDSGLPTVNSIQPYKDLEKFPIPENIDAGFEGFADCDSFHSIAQRPMLHRVANITSSMNVGDQVSFLILNPCWCPGYEIGGDFLIMPDFLAWVGMFFKYFHGSIKYMIDCSASQFTTGAIRICYFPSGTTIPDTFTSNQGDVMSIVVDIRGDTEFAFSVPYLNNYEFIQNEVLQAPGDRFNFGGLGIYIERPFTGQVEGAVCSLAMYRAGGEDSLFHTPHPHQLSGWSDVGGPTNKWKMTYHPEALIERFQKVKFQSFGPFLSKGPGKTIAYEYPDSLKAMLASPIVHTHPVGMDPEFRCVPLPPWWPAESTALEGSSPIYQDQDIWRIYALIFQFARGGQSLQRLDSSSNPMRGTYLDGSTTLATMPTAIPKSGLATFSTRGMRFRWSAGIPFIDKALSITHYKDVSNVEAVPPESACLKTPVVNSSSIYPYDVIPAIDTLKAAGPLDFAFLRCCDDDTLHFGIQTPPMIWVS